MIRVHSVPTMNGQTHTNRDSLLKVRVRKDTKERIKTAAEKLDIAQSALVRMALAEFISNHRLNAA